MLWFSLLLFGVALLLFVSDKKSKINQFFPEAEVEDEAVSAIRFSSLIEQKDGRDSSIRFLQHFKFLGLEQTSLLLFLLAYLPISLITSFLNSYS